MKGQPGSLTQGLSKCPRCGAIIGWSLLRLGPMEEFGMRCHACKHHIYRKGVRIPMRPDTLSLLAAKTDVTTEIQVKEVIEYKEQPPSPDAQPEPIRTGRCRVTLTLHGGKPHDIHARLQFEDHRQFIQWATDMAAHVQQKYLEAIR